MPCSPKDPAPHPSRRLFEFSSDLLGTATADGVLTSCNAAWEQTLGWTPAELMAGPFVAAYVHQDDSAKTMARTGRHGTDPAAAARFENRCRTRAGDYRTIAWRTMFEDGIVYVDGRDVTALRAADVAHAEAAGTALAISDSVEDGILVTDADGRLTFANPSAVRALGYQSAAGLLGRDAHVTMHHSHPDGTPYPVDECPLREAAAQGRTVHVDDDTFWRQDGTALPVSCSTSPVALAGGRGSVVAFRDVSLAHAERDRTRAAGHHLFWFQRVRHALAHDRFVLHAQPIVELTSGVVVAHELLLRMVGPDGELIAPGIFLPAAEEYGVVGDIDRWVISEALRLAAEGHAVAANLSAESLGRPDMLVHVERELARTGASPENLTFEVTETALMHDLKAGRRFADRLVTLGFRFSLDDFGIGYGSLTYLRQLPVHHVKIDVQFVRDLARSEADQKLVRGIVHIAHAMGKATIAEGVEDAECLALLRRLGVDYVQGFHLGRPEPLTANFGHAGTAQVRAGGPETARSRDLTAGSRDLAAELRDRAAGASEKALSESEASTIAARHSASEDERDHAAADRASAARDRLDAAIDLLQSTADGHAEAPPGRAERAAQRAGLARARDVAAGARDDAADVRNQAADVHERARSATEATAIQARQAVSDNERDEAAADRAGAARDRRHAATDRRRASADSARASVDLEHAQVDSLTGVSLRELGSVILQDELDRAHLAHELFVLAFVDVDGLKLVNDGAGHAAGDALLQAVARALKDSLRSCDPVVRIGGDEFLCGFTDTSLEAARARVEQIRDRIAADPTGGSVTVGLAALRPGETLHALTARADADMYERKQLRSTGR